MRRIARSSRGLAPSTRRGADVGTDGARLYRIDPAPGCSVAAVAMAADVQRPPADRIDPRPERGTVSTSHITDRIRRVPDSLQ